MVPDDQATPLMRSRREFAAYLLQLLVAIPPAAASCTSAVMLVTELATLGEKKDKSTGLVSFDPLKGELFASTTAVHDQSSGQLAVLILLAMAEARTGSEDVTSPEFVAAVYELLVRCYQNLFAPTSTGSSTSTSSEPSPTRVHGHRAAPKARSKAKTEWNDRLQEMESFLSQLEPEAPVRGSPEASSVAPVAPLMEAARRQLSGSRALSRWNLLGKSDASAASSLPTGTAAAGGSSGDLDALMRQEWSQFLLEKLDTAEKLYSHVLRQLQEQGETREYVLEMLEEERAGGRRRRGPKRRAAGPGGDRGHAQGARRPVRAVPGVAPAAGRAAQQCVTCEHLIGTRVPWMMKVFLIGIHITFVVNGEACAYL